MTFPHTKLKSALAGLIFASAAYSATAEEVNLTYVLGAFTESFDLNTTAGFFIPTTGSNVLLFRTTNDNLGYDGFGVAIPGFGGNPGNLIESSSFIDPSLVGISDSITPGTLYNGVSTTLNVAIGDSFTTGKGGTLTVAAVPEASTWAMLLSGFAALGFVGYRRQTAKST
jgi:hypothetical protein